MELLTGDVMDDQEFEQHRAALEEEGIVVEARITGRSDKPNEEVHISMVVQSDDGKKVGPQEMRVGHDYQVVFFYKGLHSPKPKRPQQRRKSVSDSTTNAEQPAASGGDSSPPDLPKNSEEVWAEAVAMRYNNICHARRNNPQFRGFLFDLSKTKIIQDPVASIAWVRNRQHEILGVESCAHIYPGTHAEAMFKWLEAAFEADKLRLPIPSRPSEAA